MLDEANVKSRSLDRILEYFKAPLMDLLYESHRVHRKHNEVYKIQLASLLSIKTGGCTEDCAYCPQSIHHKGVELDRQILMPTEEVVEIAKKSQSMGSSRFCMGVAWREVKDSKAFDRILEMISQIHLLGMEVCVTLGMLTEQQAFRLAEAGLTAYNHNLDSGPRFYPKIISTRTYRDRLQTIRHVRSAGIQVCSGGIIGMGESVQDRAEMLEILANMNPYPESVPINVLIPIKGTPLENAKPVSANELIQMIAITRILMPKTRVRLSAGRELMSPELQGLCFFAGANSIFFGDKLLTAKNPDCEEDLKHLSEWGFQISS